MCSLEQIISVVSCLTNPNLNPILKHVKYPFTASNNTTALQSAIEDLQAQRDHVNNVITNAERVNGARTAPAQRWLDKVTTIEEDAEKIQQKYRQLCRCLCKICPNVWSVYKTSQMAANKLVEVKRLSGEEPESIVHTPPPPLAQEVQASSSISPYLQQALDCVNDNNNSIIGIWGMGGVGKTHLLEQINNELCKDPTFEVVILITWSKEYSEETVQNEIIDKRGLNDHKEQKQSTIFNFLKTRSFVLLLDNLWDRVDLNKIGIPDPRSAAGTCKRKVVLTTRSTEVCGRMRVNETITVDLLKEEDAWSLFQKIVPVKIISDPLIKDCAKKVVNELGGLPLALITVGEAMSDKDDPGEWEDDLQKLMQARLNDVESLDTDQSVFHRLKFSYDSLRNETLKICFLHCSLWPEGFQIPKDELVVLWMGLGLIGNQEIHAAYNSGYSYIGRLKAARLLEVDDDKRFIKMHDLIRDMARWITKDKWIVQAGPNIIFHENEGQMESKINVSENIETLSTMQTRATKFSFSTQRPSTKLTTMLLNRNHLNKSIAFQPKLFSVLTILDLSHNNLEILPHFICKLVHLEFLNLSNNPFQLLPKELEKLTKLKYLLLRGLKCSFPRWLLSELKALRMLDFSDYNPNIVEDKLEEKYSEFFKTLTKEQFPDFQALGITIWDEQKFAEFCDKVSVPVRWLDVGSPKENCLSFSSRFFGNPEFRNLFSIDVKETCHVQHVQFEKDGNGIDYCLGRLEYLYFRKMACMKEVIWKNLDPKHVFPRLQLLEFDMCPNLSSISWVLNLPCIRELRVINCNNIKQLISIDDNGGQYPVRYLKKIHLGMNNGLKSISDPNVTFPSLEILEVYYCDNLKKLPFNTGVPPTLKEIRGPENWWKNVEMGDSSHRSSLNTFFEPVFSI